METPEGIVLLRGSGTVKIVKLLDELQIPYSGPYETLREAAANAFQMAEKGASVVLSPACTSFEMFQNEFDRGRQFKEIVLSLIEGSQNKDGFY